ncbi:MAG: deoxyuridine 5'-triphosphate nucleotidohydrolase [Thermoproteota archaeon]
MALPGSYASYCIEPKPREDSVQPAGIDLSVDEIYSFTSNGKLLTTSRSLPAARKVELQNNVWRLMPGAYKVVFAEAVRIPPSALGLCFPRSSLLRMGATVSCGVWDPGYYGRGEALLIVGNPKGIEIEKGARVAQLILIRLLPSLGEVYKGLYLGENLA